MSLLPRLALASPPPENLARLRAELGDRLNIIVVASDDEARAKVDAGEVDGALLRAPPGGPRLRVRDRVRVIEARDESAEGFLAALRSARDALVGLGVTPPALVCFEGPESAARGAALARREGIDVVGPLGPREAARHVANGHVTFTPSQSELLLELKGAGPETGLALESPCAWPCDVSPRGLVLAAERLLKVLPRPLVAEREAAKKPTVSVAKKAQATREQGRCPYCHNPLSGEPDGSGYHAGPPAACAECGTEHHRDCISEHGRCTILGCGGSRVLRLGVTIPVGRLGSTTPRDHPFATLAGDAALHPQRLRVEAPIDDPDARPSRRRLGLELSSRAIKRGEWVEGYVVIYAPRPFRVRGGAVTLRASLATQDLRAGAAPREQPILARQARFAGDVPAGALGRLQDEVVSLFVKGKGVPIPAGVRRYPFSFRLDVGHPATVKNRQGDVGESVSTLLTATLDTDAVELDLEVR